MQLIKYFFKNIFNDTRITDERLRQFTADHLRRLQEHNTDGAFSLLITDTTAAYQEYFGSAGHEASHTAISETDNLEEITWQFKARVAENELLIRNVLKKGTAAYARFFPRGLAEYTKATKDNVGPLMKRFADLAASHESQIGSTLAAAFTRLQTNYTAAANAARNEQGTAVATTYRRSHLEQQLYRNLHYIAYHYGSNTEACFRLIDQSILRLRLLDEPESFTGVIFFGATINVISMGITHHTVFRVRNTGHVPLRCALAASADADSCRNYCDVEPKQEVLIPAAELDDPATNRFFNITNLSDDIGRYEVLMED